MSSPTARATHAKAAQPGPWLALVVFIVGVLSVGLLIGYVTAPGAWYQSLIKPSFNPPSWLFGPVWTVLYVMIGIAGWRVWRSAPRSKAMGAWAIQMLLNWAWSPAFFAAQMPWLALAVIVALLATILVFIGLARKADGVAALLFVPYAVWVGFATLLNASIAVLN